MVIAFTEIMQDLELKRAAALPPDARPSIDVTDTIGDLDVGDLAIRVVGDDGRDSDFAPAAAAQLVAEALVTLAFASGEEYVNSSASRAIIRATTTNVIDRLSRAGDGRDTEITVHDLSAVVEASLIAVGQFDVAKALVMNRVVSQGETAASEATGELRLVRRSGHVVTWNEAKIEAAVGKAFLALEQDSAPATQIAARVTERCKVLDSEFVKIETIQDLVQEELVLGGHMRVAERYIVYRAERAMMRAEERAKSGPSSDFPPVPLRGASGEEVEWDGTDLRLRIDFALTDLNLDLDATAIERELRRSITPGTEQSDLQRLVTLNAKSLVERDSDFSSFAGRILLSYIYEETLDWSIERDGVEELRNAHRKALRPMLERGVAIERISSKLLEYDVERLAAALDPAADLAFDFLGLQTLYDRYLITDKTGEDSVRLESPQLFWLRVAMGVSLNETGDREARVIDLYSAYKERRFCSSTPTLFNAGTLHSQLSSCYLYKIDDSLESIMQRGIAENAMLSKWAGGLGGSWTAVRGTGSHIGGTNGESQGLVPFLKLHNDQLVAVNQGGKRAGSGCAYLETWHNDIRDFLELRRNTGDDRRRTHDMNSANWIPDLFMKRMESREQWTLFRSSDVPDLHDLYGRKFERRYEEYEAKHKAGEIWGEEIPAIDLWKQMLKMLFETGHPWITFKDPCNLRSPQDHVGVIHSSNLCTEITLNTSEEETAVCNLGSIIIDNHLTPAGGIDHDKLRETVRIAVRALDNVIDVNFYPTEAARLANSRHRPVGLGVMGLHYALFKKGVAFASDEAVEFNDEMMEAIAMYAYEASSDLAAERGTYGTYEGSKWDRGLLPQDTVDLLEAERGAPIEVTRGGKLDWTPVREKIAAQGMRNSNVLAIAPTATISNIMGTSPCIEPMYKNMFAKSNLSGDFVILNPYLVKDLKERGLWNDELASQIKLHDGDLTMIPSVPNDLRERYLTAFQIDNRFLIEAAARRQKWIDQSQSVNLFLPEPDLKAMSHMYRHAWRAGLKTTYYLRTLGASSIEKSSVVATKEEAPAPPVEIPPIVASDEQFEALSAEQIACSIEAMRNGEECEACQ